MLVYIVVFALSCFLIALSNKIQNRLVKKIIEFAAIMIPCALAGLRATSIGTDVKVYIEPLFNLANKATNLTEYMSMRWYHIWQYKYVSDFELMFNILIFAVTKLTNNVHCILFSIHFLILFPLYSGIKKFSGIKGKEWLVMMFFYLLFYNISLNAMRQFISISIFFWGFSCLMNEQKGTIKYLIAQVLAILFHTSALLGFVVFAIYKIIKTDFKHNKIIVIGKNRLQIQKVALILAIFIAIFAVFNLSSINSILNFLGLDYYNVYISGEISFNFTKLIKFIPIIILLFVVLKEFEKKENSYFYIMMFIFEIIISYFTSVNIYAIRIGYIFQFFNIIFYVLIIESSKYKTNKIIYNVILISYIGILWYHNFVYIGANETIPYIFLN